MRAVVLSVRTSQQHPPSRTTDPTRQPPRLQHRPRTLRRPRDPTQHRQRRLLHQPIQPAVVLQTHRHMNTPHTLELEHVAIPVAYGTPDRSIRNRPSATKDPAARQTKRAHQPREKAADRERTPCPGTGSSRPRAYDRSTGPRWVFVGGSTARSNWARCARRPAPPIRSCCTLDRSRADSHIVGINAVRQWAMSTKRE